MSKKEKEQQTSESKQKKNTFYDIELTDKHALDIEKESQAVAKLSEEENVPEKVRERLVREAKHLHISAIYLQREINGYTRRERRGEGTSKKAKEQKKAERSEKLAEMLAEGGGSGYGYGN